MSTQSEPATTTESLPGSWQAGVLAGIVGAAAMGALVLAMNTPTLAVAIPSLYTLAPPPNPAVGLFVHLSHGAVLGVVFAAGVGTLGLRSPGRLAIAGVGWGIVTWIGLAAVVMPLWLGVVGSPASPPFPNLAPPSLLWHVVYGVVLAGVYAVTSDRF